MIVLGLINHNWLLTGGHWQDPWRTFGSMTSFGSLSPEAAEHYKSLRTLLVLSGQVLIWLLGKYWGQVALAAINLLAMYVATRYLLRVIYGRAHALATALVLYFPGFHGVGGWMYGISFSLPLVVFSLALIVKLGIVANSEQLPKKFPSESVLLGMACAAIWFVHPGALPSLLVAGVSGLICTVVVARSLTMIRRLIGGILLGGLLGVCIGELAGFAIGLRRSAVFSALNSYRYLAADEQMSAFRRPLHAWLPDAVYLAPVGLGLSFAIAGVLIVRPNLRGQFRSRFVGVVTLYSMCLGAMFFFVVYELDQQWLLSYNFYSPLLLQYVMLLGSVGLQNILQGQPRYPLQYDAIGEYSPLLTTLVVAGWQATAQWLSIPDTLLLALVAWCAVGGIMIVGSVTFGYASLGYLCFGALMFGVLSGGPQYAVKSCDNRRSETKTILSLVTLAESGFFQDRLGPVYVIAAPSDIDTKCEPSIPNILSSVGDQIPPFQVASSLQLNAIQRPNASTLVLGSNDRAVRQELHVAQTVPGLKDTLVARPVPNIYGVTALEVFHRDLTELTRVLKPLMEGSGRPIAEWVEEVLNNETYLTLNQLVRDKPESRTVLIATSENDVFEALFPKVVGHFPVKSESTANDTETIGVCEALSESRAEGIVVGLGVTQDALSLDRLARAKKVVQDCLARLGWRYVAEPDNSESPLVIHILNN